MIRKIISIIRDQKLSVISLTATSGVLAGFGATNSAIAANSESFGLEEVVVTARKREESLQDTPISVAAYSGQALEDRGTPRIDGIGQFTPNLSFDAVSPRGSSGSAAITLRGIGQTDFVPTSEPGVGLYIDGVYLARSVGSVLDLLDVERVEVLRGPQGTLFGRNTIGGAVSITTVKPDETLSAKLEATTGSSNRIDAKGFINIPISDTFFAKVSAASSNRDGYVKGLGDGQDLGNDNKLTGRLALRWLATDNLEFNVSIDGTRQRENAAPFVLIDADGTAPFPAFHNAVIAGGSCFPPPGSTSNSACYNNQWLSGPYQSKGTSQAFMDLDVWGIAGTIDWSLDWMEVKSVTSYRDVNSSFSRDADHSPLKIANLFDLFEQNQFSQEVQFSGNSFDDRLNWLVGLYYFTESANNINILDVAIAKFQSGGLVDNESYAAFAQATYDITDKLSITGGIRYTDESKKFTPVQFVISSLVGLPPGLRLLPEEEGKISISEWTPMVNVAYRWTDNLMTYVTYSEGFKSGGFTQRVFPPRADVPSFLPEFVKVYEAGFKLFALENRLRLNAAAFKTDYSDLQITVEDGVSPIVRNAAAATIKGFELELSAAPIDGLLLEAGVGYLDASYDKVDPAATGITIDKKFVKSPKWSLNSSISYEFPIGEYGTLRPRVDWSYRTKVYNNPINTSFIAQDAYHLVNTSLSFNSANDDWSVILRGTNLTKKKYLITGLFNPDFGTNEGVYGRPREWSLTVRYRY